MKNSKNKGYTKNEKTFLEEAQKIKRDRTRYLRPIFKEKSLFGIITCLLRFIGIQPDLENK